MAEVVAAGKSDADLAADLKSEMAKLLEPVCALLSRSATDRKMLIQWDGFGADQFGRWTPNDLRVVKRLT